MINLKKKYKPYAIALAVFISIILLLLLVQFILGKVLQNKLESALANKNKSSYSIAVNKVKVNLFTMTLIIKDISVIPDSTLISKLKSHKSDIKKPAFDIHIKKLRVRHISLYSFIMDKVIDAGSFIIDDATVYMYNPLVSESKRTESQTHEFKPDSIVLSGIAGLNIDDIFFNNISFGKINLQNSDTGFLANNIDFEIESLALVKNEAKGGAMKIIPGNISITMHDKFIKLPGGLYSLSFSNISIILKQKLLVLNKLQIHPRYSRSKMVSFSKFNKEVYTCDINKIEIQSFSFSDILHNSDMLFSKVIVDSMSLDIFKDKRLPFDTLKRPQLPVQQLRNLNLNLDIDSILINNSVLVYSERHKSMDELMKVTLSELNVKVANITSIFDSIIAGDMLKIKMRAKLQNKIPMGVNIYMPMNSTSDTFSFNGWLGSGNMKLFNNILLPAIGIKFVDGHIDGVKFKAKANATYSIGEMTMLYHGLDGVVVRKDPKKTNKFLSWVANTAMIKNNPTPNKEKRIEPMFFKRVTYKGLGNYLWKTLQSGITATLIPTMNKGVQKNIDTKLGTSKKAVRKRERAKKRKNKHEK